MLRKHGLYKKNLVLSHAVVINGDSISNRGAFEQATAVRKLTEVEERANKVEMGSLTWKEHIPNHISKDPRIGDHSKNQV